MRRDCESAAFWRLKGSLSSIPPLLNGNKSVLRTNNELSRAADKVFGFDFSRIRHDAVRV